MSTRVEEAIKATHTRVGVPKTAWTNWDHHVGADLRDSDGAAIEVMCQAAFYAGWDYAGGQEPRTENEKLKKNDLKGLLAAPDNSLNALAPAEVRALVRMALKGLKAKKRRRKLAKKVSGVAEVAQEIEDYAEECLSGECEFSEDMFGKLTGNLEDAAYAAYVSKDVRDKINNRLLV